MLKNVRLFKRISLLGGLFKINVSKKGVTGITVGKGVTATVNTNGKVTARASTPIQGVRLEKVVRKSSRSTVAPKENRPFGTHVMSRLELEAFTLELANKVMDYEKRLGIINDK